jgi:hypothetical protein
VALPVRAVQPNLGAEVASAAGGAASAAAASDTPAKHTIVAAAASSIERARAPCGAATAINLR